MGDIKEIKKFKYKREEAMKRASQHANSDCSADPAVTLHLHMPSNAGTHLMDAIY